MYFIILSTALTLHRQGITNITTSAQAATALEPFAGRFATMLFSLGIVGAGVLAILHSPARRLTLWRRPFIGIRGSVCRSRVRENFTRS